MRKRSNVAPNPLIEEILRAGSITGSDSRCTKIFPTSVRREDGMALHNFIKKTRPMLTLEVGMAYGIASLFIRQAIRENGIGHHIVLDPFQKSRWKSLGLSNLQRAGFGGLFTFNEGYSHDVLPLLLSKGKVFDFIFIDGAHRFDYAMLDFFYSDKLLKNNGFIMFHDMCMPSVRKVIQFVIQNLHYEIRPEFTWERYPAWKRALVLLRDIFQTHLDLHSIAFSLIKFIKKLPNYCFLKKISADNRDWRFHRNF